MIKIKLPAFKSFQTRHKQFSFDLFCSKSRKIECKTYFDNFQSHDQEESELNSTIIANSGFHTYIDDKTQKSPFNKNYVEVINKPVIIMLL